MSCARTGELGCKCLHPRDADAPLNNTRHSTLRKLFTDHAVYTAFVLKSVVDGLSAAPGGAVDTFLQRLLDNQTEIGDYLAEFISDENGDRLTHLLQDHIERAAAVIVTAVKGEDVTEVVAKLFKNSEKVADFLNSLNPEKLPYDDVKEMFDDHNTRVIDMTLARIEKDYTKEIVLYDSYYNEILELSDAIADAL